jgi:hypothetical protein
MRNLFKKISIILTKFLAENPNPVNMIFCIRFSPSAKTGSPYSRKTRSGRRGLGSYIQSLPSEDEQSEFNRQYSRSAQQDIFICICYVSTVPMYDTKSLRYCSQCCGIDTVGTVTFCLSGTGTRMHYGSRPGPELDLDPAPT